MKKKIFSLTLVLCILLSMAVVPVSAEVVASGECGENVTWTLDDSGKLVISGTGAMEAYAYQDTPWYNKRLYIKSVVIDNGIANISIGAFSECEHLTSVTIPDSVTIIDESAFDYCKSLASITIPASVTSIGDGAFFECTKLSSITLPDSVTNLNRITFEFCNSLTSITIPAGVTYLGHGIFWGCEKLSSITIPVNVTTIESSAFEGCDSLTDVYYGGSEADWNKISIGNDNDCLKNADIHFNSKAPESGASASTDITVLVGGSPVAFDVPPTIIDGRTLVPMRAIFETLGAGISWEDATKTVTSEKDGTTVSLSIGSNTLYVNGEAIELDVPAMIVDGRTLVPVRAVAESFKCKVGWDDATKTVLIETE